MKRIPKPKLALISVPCECGTRTQSSLIPGGNDVTAICDGCGAVLRYDVDYDGYGMATIKAGTIETVVPE
jgi:hypothetical protein